MAAWTPPRLYLWVDRLDLEFVQWLPRVRRGAEASLFLPNPLEATHATGQHPPAERAAAPGKPQRDMIADAARAVFRGAARAAKAARGRAAAAAAAATKAAQAALRSVG